MEDVPGLYDTDGLAADVYDARTALIGQPIEGDVAFYLRFARMASGPVLELGAGTGRVACALAAQGVEVVGLDLSRPMLDRARAKRAVLPESARQRLAFIEGDMSRFDLGRRFGLVIAPFRAFQCLLTPEDQRRALGCIRGHLDPQGRLILHLFDPRLDFLVPGGAAPPMREHVRHPVTGKRVTTEIVNRTTDPVHQRITETWRTTETGEDGTVLRREEASLSLRWTYRWEMRHLFELCGFQLEAEYSDFAGTEPAYGKEQIWVARPHS